MFRQAYYTSEWENKNKYPEISLWISGKAGEKTFCCRICHYIFSHFKSVITWEFRIKDTWKIIQPYKNVEANKSQSSLSKLFEASASSNVLHQETFTIPSY